MNSITLTWEKPGDKELGAMTVTANGNAVGPEDAVELEFGESIVMTADNATAFDVDVDGTTATYTATNGSFIWTPDQEIDAALVTITPKMGDTKGDALEFMLSVEKKLGQMTITGPAGAVADNGEVSIALGESFTISAENATKFEISVNEEETYTLDGPTAKWTPEKVYDRALVFVTPYHNSTKGGVVAFELTAKIKIGVVNVSANGKAVENGGTAQLTLGETITMSAANADLFSVYYDGLEEYIECVPVEGVASWTPDAVMFEKEITVTPSVNDKSGDEFKFVLTVKKDLAEFGWSAKNVTVVDGEEFDLPVFNCSDADVEVVFASSNPEVADVEGGEIVLKGGYGTTELTATLTDHQEYNDAVAVCTVTVKRPGVKAPQHTGLWRLITDVNDLKDGEIYTLVCDNKVANTSYSIADKRLSSSAISFYNEEITQTQLFSTTEQTKAALFVLFKEGDYYSLYLTNGLNNKDPQVGFVTCYGLTKSGENMNQISLEEELTKDASRATIEIDAFGSATIKFLTSDASESESNRLYLHNKGSYFACYESKTGSNPSIYGVHTPAPQVDVVSENDDEYEVKLFTEMPGAEIWYRVMPVKSVSKVLLREATEGAEEEVPYVQAPNDHHVVLSTDKRVDYYSVLYGRQSDMLSHSKAAGTTGIGEVKHVVEQGPTEWFDLQGRRVSAPAKGGVYILRQGTRVTKLAL
ncbi:MAG: hypothetical protein NC301_00800 [Bacteroides sp.]|nr:hypothetical protein [Bacteroides sp.]MCM1378850.1 hypothetical protein [Bacteroides sp.]MCM1445467.1 hypothetical protein [Prevotella sp.]